MNASTATRTQQVRNFIESEGPHLFWIDPSSLTELYRESNLLRSWLRRGETRDAIRCTWQQPEIQPAVKFDRSGKAMNRRLYLGVYKSDYERDIAISNLEDELNEVEGRIAPFVFRRRCPLPDRYVKEGRL